MRSVIICIKVVVGKREEIRVLRGVVYMTKSRGAENRALGNTTVGNKRKRGCYHI